MNILNILLRRIYKIDVDSLLNERKRLSEEIGRHQSRCNSLTKDKTLLKEQVDQITSELVNEKEKLNHEILESNKLRKHLDDISKDLLDTKDIITSKEKEIKNLRCQIEEKDEEIHRLNERAESSPIKDNEVDNEVQDQIDNLNRENARLHEVNKKNDIEIKRLNGELNKKESTITGQDIEIKERDKIIEDLKSKLNNSPNDINPGENNESPVDVTDDNPSESSPIILVEGANVAYIDGVPTNIGDIDKTKRTIDTVLDIEENKIISARSFFSQPESLVFKMRKELEDAIYLQKPHFVCKYCGQMVKISGRKTQRGVARFFSHLRDSDDCDYKTTTGRSKREIERAKYARCNEGERHKFLKSEIAKYLKGTKGISEVKLESTFKGNHPILRWRRPDVYAKYRGQDVVFELQLSTTFISVIAERDLFYRMNNTHIIWIFNFDEQAEHVDLTNMMTKDIYYNNHFNIFIFDKEAQKQSEERGEFMLKCNWIKPDGNWEYENGNTSDNLGGELISLSDLTFDNAYKPYYKDAEKDFLAENKLYIKQIKSIEEKNVEILERLDELWRIEQIKEGEKIRKTEERKQEILQDFEAFEKKSTTNYILGERKGELGLLTYDSLIRIPFEYEEIKVHRGWIEAQRTDSIDVFNADYKLVFTGAKRIEKLDSELWKYAEIVNGDWLWGLMGSNGLPLCKAIYSKIEIWAEKKYKTEHNGCSSVIRGDGSEIISGYDYIGNLDESNKAEIEKDGYKGYIDVNCHIVDTNEQKLEGGFSKICQVGLWGIKNEDGSINIPCKYDDLGSINNCLIGLSGSDFSIVNESFSIDCPVKVKYVTKNERKMLIFKVGKREAFMNIRQQQKAIKKGIKPKDINEMYISHVNAERGLLYLSSTPVKGPIFHKTVNVNDTDIALGTIFEGSVVHVDSNYIIIKSENERTAYVHRSTWGNYSITDFNKGQMVRVEKIGFDYKYNKHVWKILSVFYAM
ncbi:MAG: hypothetical protein J5952_05055 [Prevotella sp.]|nr:hypothetical protein [Prevotella sp.]